MPGIGNYRHGCARKGKVTPEYQAWQNMHRRCYEPTHNRFQHYGGRGIAVCARWFDSVAFLGDMGPMPQPGMSLDRKDNDGPYSPDNCRWATRSQQLRNTSRAIIVDTPWGRVPLKEAAERSGIKYKTLFARVRYGSGLGVLSA